MSRGRAFAPIDRSFDITVRVDSPAVYDLLISLGVFQG